jgi:hypothetical protein
MNVVFEPRITDVGNSLGTRFAYFCLLGSSGISFENVEQLLSIPKGKYLFRGPEVTPPNV